MMMLRVVQAWIYSWGQAMDTSYIIKPDLDSTIDLPLSEKSWFLNPESQSTILLFYRSSGKFWFLSVSTLPFKCVEIRRQKPSSWFGIPGKPDATLLVLELATLSSPISGTNHAFKGVSAICLDSAVEPSEGKLSFARRRNICNCEMTAQGLIVTKVRARENILRFLC